MAQDLAVTNPSELTGPAVGLVAVTPNDSTDLTFRSRAIFVGTGGDIAVIPSHGDQSTPVVLKNVPSGAMLPIRVNRVMAANTTAQNIVNFY